MPSYWLRALRQTCKDLYAFLKDHLKFTLLAALVFMVSVWIYGWKYDDVAELDKKIWWGVAGFAAPWLLFVALIPLAIFFAPRDMENLMKEDHKKEIDALNDKYTALQKDISDANSQHAVEVKDLKQEVKEARALTPQQRGVKKQLERFIVEINGVKAALRSGGGNPLDRKIQKDCEIFDYISKHFPEDRRYVNKHPRRTTLTNSRGNFRMRPNQNEVDPLEQDCDNMVASIREIISDMEAGEG